MESAIDLSAVVENGQLVVEFDSVATAFGRFAAIVGVVDLLTGPFVAVVDFAEKSVVEFAAEPVAKFATVLEDLVAKFA